MSLRESPDDGACDLARKADAADAVDDADDQGQWMSWEDAAALVGCAVPTIDWHSRTGRIEKRAFRGNRPSLRRSSVEDFGRWWRQRQAERAEQVEGQRNRTRAARSAVTSQTQAGRTTKDRRAVTPPEGYVSTADAAAYLGVSQSHVPHLIVTGKLDAIRDVHRWWVRRSSMVTLRDERHRWLSFASAAALICCATSTVHLAVQAGQIEQRTVPRWLPSLDRDSVLEFARRRRDEQRHRDEARRRREAEKAVVPPDGTHTWLQSTDVARILNLSRSRVDQLSRAGRLPCREIRGHRWFRADHIEGVRASREFVARAASGLA